MKRRKTALLGLAAALAACAGIAYFMLPPSGRGSTLESAWRVEQGMTLQEVEAVLRAPPGDYSGTSNPFWEGMTVKALTGAKARPSHVWLGEEVSVAIWTDEAGRVGTMTWVEHAYQGQSIVRKLRRWAGF